MAQKDIDTPFKAWAAFEEDDEGRERTLIGVFVSESEAQKHGNKRGAWGRNSQPRAVWVIWAGDSYGAGMVWLLSKQHNCYSNGKNDIPVPVKMGVNLIQQAVDRKAAALAKLSPEDKEVLGIKE